MNLREAAQQALEALENSIDTVRHEYAGDWRHGSPTRKAQLDGKKESVDNHENAITALRAALAAPIITSDYPNSHQLKPLTDEEIDQIAIKCLDAPELGWNRNLARAIEHAHGIKENP